MKDNAKYIAAAKIIDELARRKPKRYIEEIAKAFVDGGIIDVGEEAINQMVLIKTRNLIERTRRIRRHNRQTHLEFVNLEKPIPGEGTEHYFKRVKDLDKDESVYLLTSCWKRGRYWDKELRTYADVLLKKHGEPLQLELIFDITPFMDPAEEPQDA